MTNRTKVVITGVGAVCAAGREVEEVWEALHAGRSGVAPIRQWDATGWPTPIAGEVGVAPRVLVEDRRLHKLIRRTDMFGLYAAGKALEGSGLLEHRETLDQAAVERFNDRTGVFAGSGGGSYQNQYEFFPLLTEAGGDLRAFGRELTALVNPMWLLRNLPNNVVCHIGIRYGLKGANACVTNHCVSGSLAVAEAAAAIRDGDVDRAVAVGHDTQVEPEAVLHFGGLELLAQSELRPFDAGRDGILLGEGAASVVLEKADEAAARGATVWGEFLGCGCASEAAGLMGIRSDGEGVVDAVRLALEDAGLEPASVGMIVAHGNGTSQSDASEAAAIRRVFGASPPPVTGFKWAFGHLMAASGSIDMVLALAALRHKTVPGIATLRMLDPAFPSLPVSATAQTPMTDIALVINRGFAGMNVALLVRGLGNS
jgi:3-oxoacyl-[acyl-carrier-protein] synthase I